MTLESQTIIVADSDPATRVFLADNLVDLPLFFSTLLAGQLRSAGSMRVAARLILIDHGARDGTASSDGRRIVRTRARHCSMRLRLASQRIAETQIEG